MASLFFFVKKKDGKLQPVQDYWKLNEITVKNRYPLPLISDILTHFEEQGTSPNSTYDGDTTIFAYKKEMNGKQHSEQIEDFLSQL
jgi:hypothetical protein